MTRHIATLTAALALLLAGFLTPAHAAKRPAFDGYIYGTPHGECLFDKPAGKVRAELTCQRRKDRGTDKVTLHRHLRPCRAEDSRGCYWIATQQGNGHGRSFVDLRGRAYYLR